MNVSFREGQMTGEGRHQSHNRPRTLVARNTPLSMSAAPPTATQIIALNEPNQKVIAVSTRDAP